MIELRNLRREMREMKRNMTPQHYAINFHQDTHLRQIAPLQLTYESDSNEEDESSLESEFVDITIDADESREFDRLNKERQELSFFLKNYQHKVNSGRN